MVFVIDAQIAGISGDMLLCSLVNIGANRAKIIAEQKKRNADNEKALAEYYKKYYAENKQKLLDYAKKRRKNGKR